MNLVQTRKDLAFLLGGLIGIAVAAAIFSALNMPSVPLYGVLVAIGWILAWLLIRLFKL